MFLNTSSDATLLGTILEAAARHGAVPADDVMQSDVDAHDMSPLFDGADLERI